MRASTPSARFAGRCVLQTRFVSVAGCRWQPPLNALSAGCTAAAHGTADALRACMHGAAGWAGTADEWWTGLGFNPEPCNPKP